MCKSRNWISHTYWLPEKEKKNNHNDVHKSEYIFPDDKAELHKLHSSILHAETGRNSPLPTFWWSYSRQASPKNMLISLRKWAGFPPESDRLEMTPLSSFYPSLPLLFNKKMRERERERGEGEEFRHCLSEWNACVFIFATHRLSALITRADHLGQLPSSILTRHESLPSQERVGAWGGSVKTRLSWR